VVLPLASLNSCLRALRQVPLAPTLERLIIRLLVLAALL
jgi:hypothetical protein